MPRVIDAEKCLACGACQAECPVDAISENTDKGVYEIDGDQCIDCGACQGVCPADAITE